MPLLVDGILMQAVNNSGSRDQAFVLGVEQQCRRLFNSQDNRLGSLEFPGLNSFYRMLTHRVARFYGLQHYVCPQTRCISVYRDDQSRLPPLTLAEMVEPVVRVAENVSHSPLPKEPIKKFKIMKRASKADAPTECTPAVEKKSVFLSKQEDYDRIRERLFADIPQEESLEEASPLSTEDVPAEERSAVEAVPYYPSYYHQMFPTPSESVASKNATTTSNPVVPLQEIECVRVYSSNPASIKIPRHIVQTETSVDTAPKSSRLIRDDQLAILVFASIDEADRYRTENVSATSWQPQYLPFDMLKRDT